MNSDELETSNSEEEIEGPCRRTRSSRNRVQSLRTDGDEDSSDTGRGSPKRPKKSSSRASRRSKTLTFDSTDSEEESESEEDWDSDDLVETGPFEEEEKVPSRSIDKVFDYREVDGSCEWFLKWKGKSHRNSEWVPEEEVLEIGGGKMRIRNFRTNPPPQPREPYYPAEYEMADRIIAERVVDLSSDEEEEDVEMDDSKKKEQKEYLVKWKALGYAESTWEKEDDLPQEHIDLYVERNTPPTCKPMERLIYRKGIQPPEFRDPALRLRPYQVIGFRWLLFSYAKDVNVILGDEMGLGKTIQSASFLYYLYQCRNNNGPFLVVSPLVTLEQWRREIESWTTMNCLLFHGNAADRKIIVDNEFYFDDNKKKGSKSFKFNILLTTYETVIQETSLLSMIRWEYLVLDEGHRIKNQSSKILRHLNQLKLKNKIILTGTPLQNHITELWTILNFLNPSKFGSRDEFLEEYGDLNATSAEKLKSGIRRYLLRRMKSDVEKSLPTKEEKIIEVELTSVQKQYYRALFERNRDFLQRGVKNRSNVSSLRNIVMELRKCSSHPYLIPGAEERILGGARGSKAVGEALIMSSAKLIVLDKLLKKLREEGRYVLIFSQLKLILDILEDFLHYREYPYERLDGGVRKEDRVAAIDRFTNIKGDQFVFLLSTRAGGLGLNLTRADTVIIFDSDFNPQNDLQAMARAHRIGQTNNVVVYRLITKGTYEQKMLEIAGKKMALDTAVLGGEQGNSKDDLGADEVDALLRYGAYHLFQENENDEDEKKKDQMLQEEDIDEILNRAATIVHKEEESGSGGSGLSRISFCVSEKDAEVDLNADDFWERVLPDFKNLETLKQDMAEGKVKTLEQKKVFVEHLQTLVDEAREDIARGQKMLGEMKGLVSLTFFLEEVLSSLGLTGALQSNVHAMLSSIQLKKRSRTALSSEIAFMEPETKRRKTEKPSKQSLLENTGTGRGIDDDDDEEYKIESDSDSDKKAKKLFLPKKASFWTASNLKRVKTLVNKFPMLHVDELYEIAPSVLQKNKSLGQFGAMVNCQLYLAFEIQASDPSPDPLTLKYAKQLKKKISAHAGLLADFRSLGFVPQPNSSLKESKKPVQITIETSVKHTDGLPPSTEVIPPTVFTPGDVIAIKLSIPEGFYEPQKAVYLEVVGKHISFSYPLDREKAPETRFYTQRIESERNGLPEEREFVLYAPPCTGEYTIKCVKMYLRNGPKDFKHIVCGQLPISVALHNSVKEGIALAPKSAGTLVVRGVSAEVLRRCAEDPDFVLPRHQMRKPVWWWNDRDDKALLQGFHVHGFESFEEIEKDETSGFTMPILTVRLEKALEDLSPETQSALRMTLNDKLVKSLKKKGVDFEDREVGELEQYYSEELKAYRSVLTKRVNAIVKACLVPPVSKPSPKSPVSLFHPEKGVIKKVENGVGKEKGKVIAKKENGTKKEEKGKENGLKEKGKENGVKEKEDEKKSSTKKAPLKKSSSKKTIKEDPAL